MRRFNRVIVPAAAVLMLFSGAVTAEPYFAINTGHKCAACHVNPTGGGKRTSYGNAFAQMAWPARKPAEFWDPRVAGRLGLGGDIRMNALVTRIPNQEDQSSFDLEEALLYAELSVLPGTLTLYLDQRVGPGGSSNRETYALMKLLKDKVFVKAGRMFLPFGWRLEDDSEFVRQVSGINYNTPDEGVEIGLELDRASLSLAVTNGAGGGSESDTGKQVSFSGTYIRPRWRAGASFNFNDTDGGDRRMQAVFAGLKTWRVNWLAEMDYIVDEGTPTGRREQLAGFLEANIIVRQGHNLKVTYGYFDPDDAVDENDRNRLSLVWEYFPLAFTQLSIGARRSDGIPQSDAQNTKEYFIQLHTYF